MIEDQQIWNRIIDDDVDALRILHDKYYSQMWIWSSKYTRNQALSEELVSDCFIKIWDRRKFIFIEKSLKSYLFLMLRNQIISHGRKSKHELIIDSVNLPDIPDEETLDKLDFYAELYRVINKIPEQRRKILELAVFRSLTYNEIADLLDISVNTVKTQMGRAYQFLKEELDPTNFLLFQIFFKKEKF